MSGEAEGSSQSGEQPAISLATLTKLIDGFVKELRTNAEIVVWGAIAPHFIIRKEVPGTDEYDFDYKSKSHENYFTQIMDNFPETEADAGLLFPDQKPKDPPIDE